MSIYLDCATEQELAEIARQIFIEDLIGFIKSKILNNTIPSSLNLEHYLAGALERAAGNGVKSRYGLAAFLVMEMAANRTFSPSHQNPTFLGVHVDETESLVALFQQVQEVKRDSWTVETEKKFISTLQQCHDQFSDSGDIDCWYRSLDVKENFLTYLEGTKLDVVGFSDLNKLTYHASTGTLCQIGDFIDPKSFTTTSQQPKHLWIPVLLGQPSNIKMRMLSNRSFSSDTLVAWVSDDQGVRRLDPDRPLVSQIQTSGPELALWPDINAISNLPTAIILNPRTGLPSEGEVDAEQLTKSVEAIVRLYDNAQHLRVFEWYEWPALEYKDDKLIKSGPVKARFTHQTCTASGLDSKPTEKAFESRIEQGLTTWFDAIGTNKYFAQPRWTSESKWLWGHFSFAYGLCCTGNPEQTPFYRIQTATKLGESKIDFRWSAQLEILSCSSVIHLDCVSPLAFDLNDNFGFFIDESLKPELLPKQEIKIPILASLEPIVQVGKPVLTLRNSRAGELTAILEMFFCQITQRIVPRFMVTSSAITLDFFLKDGLLGDLHSSEILLPEAQLFEWTMTE